MKKAGLFLTIVALLCGAIATAATINGTPLVPRPLQATDRVPMGFPGNTAAYTLSIGQVMDYVQANYSGARSGGGGAGDMLATTYDPTGVHASAFARANHTGTQPASTVTGLAPVATSGAYGDLSGTPTIPATLAGLASDSTHRTVTDAQTVAWDSKQAALTSGTDYVAPGLTITAGVGLTGGGDLSANRTLTLKITDSTSTTDSSTAASATAVKAAYDLAAAGGSITSSTPTTFSSGTVVASNGTTARAATSGDITGVLGYTPLAPAGNGASLTGITAGQVGADTTGAAAAVAARTVNGHALTSNVVVAAGDITTGTLPHAQLPALVSGDIPANAANTSGNAATATALAATPTACTGGQVAAGVDAHGNATGCVTPGGTYTLPTATSAVLGGVKPDGVTILNTAGVLTVTPYTIGAASATQQVIAGTGLAGGGTLAADRTLSVTYGTTSGTAAQGNDVRLGAGAVTGAIKSNGSNSFSQAGYSDLATGAPTATTSVLGLVKPDGTTITITGGVISTVGGSGTVTSIGGTGTVNGLSLSGTVTTTGNLTLGGSLSGTASGLTAGAVTGLTATTALTNNGGAGTLTWPATGATLTVPTGGGTLGTGAFAAAYSLPTATTTTLGGVKVDGTTVTITGGVISAASSGGTWGSITGTLASQSDLNTALAAKAPLASPTFTGTVSGITGTMVGLSAVTNDAQTKAAVVPNTAPSAGQLLVGNAGGTAYAPVTITGPVGLTSAGVTSIADATSAVKGLVKVDGTTITATGGVISAVGGGMTALTGDVTASGTGSVAATVGKINGVTVDSAAPSSGDFLRNNGTTWLHVPLTSGDIPANAANTSGTAANLSGTPALPNGTTATTQTVGTNNTTVATTAFVLANAGGSPASSTTNATYYPVMWTGTSYVYNTSITANPSTASTGATTSSATTATNGTTSSRQTTRPVVTDTDGATITFDMSASTGTDVHDVMLGGNRTLAFSGTAASQFFAINLKQDSTGSRTVTWPSGITWMNTSGNAAPVLLSAVSKIDTFTCRVIIAGSAYQCWNAYNQ